MGQPERATALYPSIVELAAEKLGPEEMNWKVVVLGVEQP
jgi:hypothetical protein